MNTCSILTRCRPLLAALLTLWTLSAAGQTFDRALTLWENRVNWSPIQTKVDKNGNIYMAGYFSDTAVIGGFTLIDSDTSAGGNTFDGVVAKFDSLGICQWATPINGSRHDKANAAAIDSAGNVYVCGSFTSYELRLGALRLYNSGPYADAFVAKLDGLTGQWQWAHRAGGADGDEAGEQLLAGTHGDVYYSGTLPYYFRFVTISHLSNKPA